MKIGNDIRMLGSGPRSGIGEIIQKATGAIVHAADKTLGNGRSIDSLDQADSLDQELANLPFALHTNAVGFTIEDNKNGTFGFYLYYGSWHSQYANHGSPSVTEGALSLYTLNPGTDGTDPANYTVEAYGEGGSLTDKTFLPVIPGHITSDIHIKPLDHYLETDRDPSTSINDTQAGDRTDITDMGFTPEGRPATELLDEAERKVLDIAESSRRTTSGPRAGAEFLGDVVERIEKLVGGQLAGTSTGLVDLDKKTTGLHPGDLVIVAGRPSMGKTSFSMNIAEAIATDPQTPKAVLVFSLEMPGDQLMMRMISSFGRVNQERLRSGNLTDEDWDKIHSAMTLLERAPIYIDDDGQLSPTELRSRARRLKREVNNIRSEQFPEGLELGLILVDYLQLMQVPGFKENRTNEIAMISRGMKSLAKELEVPVIALSQLNRSVENRDDKRPRMADLRESGGIEQDADVIMFIYRDEVYNPETDRRGIAEIIIAKQRNGPIGKVDATFTGQYTRFDNVAHYQDDEF